MIQRPPNQLRLRHLLKALIQDEALIHARTYLCFQVEFEAMDVIIVVPAGLLCGLRLYQLKNPPPAQRLTARGRKTPVIAATGEGGA